MGSLSLQKKSQTVASQTVDSARELKESSDLLTTRQMFNITSKRNI